MSTEAVTPAIEESLRGGVQRRRRLGRWFFVGFAIATAATVLLGFSRTYYLKSLFAAPSLPILFHIHGALFTVWVLLFIAQSLLIAQSRTAVHRKLGIVGGLLVVPMLVTGVMVAILAAKGQGPVSAAAARGEFALRARPAFPPLVGMVVPLTSVLLFSTFVAIGLAYRRRPNVHKRLMALGVTSMLPPALGRAIATLAGFAPPALFFGATILFIAAIGAYDLRTRGRVHPVTIVGGLLLVASFPVRLALGHTDLWIAFAGWLVR
jgi:hypothetical protein